jgi:inosine-uridine nucleoside N-ribohydrolase
MGLKSLAFPVILLVTFGATPPVEGDERAPKSRMVILDTDPGIDDAMAILFALRSPALEVLGITTVFGNADIEVGTANALRLVELAGRDVPVARRAEHPWVVPKVPPPDFVHGADGLGNINAAVGRLTNLALALALEPRLPTLVKEVWGDPHAADIVFTAPWGVTMVGLDVTTRVLMPDELLVRMAGKNERVGGFLYRISRFYRRFQETTGVTGGFYVHDPSAVAYAIDPSLFSTEMARVRVVTEGIALGQTIAVAGPVTERWEAWRGRPEVTVCREVDAQRLLRLFETTITP